MFTLILTRDGEEVLIVNAIEDDLDAWYAFAARFGFEVTTE